jgi:hypothetical protein
MDDFCKTIIWKQFGAAIDALENAIDTCPDDLWYDDSRMPPVWALIHHTLFWLDYYLSSSMDDFSPPEPFGLEELDPSGKLPERPYGRDELLKYLEYGRHKCRTTIESMTEEQACRTYNFGKVNISFGELLLYNMRHVQHGAAQLNLILRQSIDSAPRWTFRARD